ncbi:MAG: hypothetical protein A2Z34_05945 [Planctomycetes bacterium RBG_16_59_8]|nr:MAG: hypothetical protein A2Z34_05945 [Planctomycetes bacterium RBG_16_59_8]
MHSHSSSLAHLLATRRVVLLDGGMGSEIERRGFPTELPLWSARALLENPALVKEIHRDYIRAGADIVTTNTFRTNRRTLAKKGFGDRTEELVALACRLPREAWEESGCHGLTAYAIAPLEDCYTPALVPDRTSLLREHEEQVRLAAEQDINFIKAETFNSIREAEAVARFAAESGREFTMSFLVEGEHLLNGDLLAQAVETIEPYGPVAFLVNCRPPERLTLSLETLQQCTERPTGIYANGMGIADDAVGGKNRPIGIDAAEYIDWVRRWIDMGARLIGGCCGTTPAHISAIRKIVG